MYRVSLIRLKQFPTTLQYIQNGATVVPVNDTQTQCTIVLLSPVLENIDGVLVHPLVGFGILSALPKYYPYYLPSLGSQRLNGKFRVFLNQKCLGY